MTSSESILMLLILSGAFLIPFAARRLSIPSSVGELIYGLVLIYFLPHTFHSHSVLEFLSELGFLLLMLLAGIEIDVEKIITSDRDDLKKILIHFMIITAVSVILVHILGQPLIFCTVYLCTALGLLYPVLKEADFIKNKFGQKLLTIGTIGEILTLLSITLILIYYNSGISFQSLFKIFNIFIFFIISVYIHKLIKTIIWWFPDISAFFIKTGGTTESGIRGSLLIMFIFVVLASLWKMELIIGSFLAGIYFSITFKNIKMVEKKLNGFSYGFLIPLFFITFGMKFRIQDFLNIKVILYAMLISLIIPAIRYVSLFPLFFTKLKTSRILIIPVSTSFPLTLMVAAANIGQKIKVSGKPVLNTEESAAIVLAAILTSLIYPFIFRKFLNKVK